jgi:hypothetical protein
LSKYKQIYIATSLSSRVKNTTEMCIVASLFKNHGHVSISIYSRDSKMSKEKQIKILNFFSK